MAGDEGGAAGSSVSTLKVIRPSSMGEFMCRLNIWVMMNMLVLFWQFFKQAYAGKKGPAKDAAASAPTEKAAPTAVAAGGGDKKTN